MAQESVAQGTSHDTHENEHSTKGSLGPLLCWAVVFADIGTSVYYTPGILYGTVQGLAGFFVMLTMVVFVLLCLKYVEVTHRFPQGGGVVTVAAQGINPWAGALGGMFILVDYFLTAAISCLSGIIYLSIVFPALGPPTALWITVGILVLLGFLNWIGISESAKVSLIGAIIAFLSDIAILITVFTHISFGEFLTLFPKMFSHALTPTSFLAGFAGAFLAFSGLESISQLSPVMQQPHKKVASIAMALVVITVGLTSPLLTMFATLLQPDKADSLAYRDQLISLLAGHWGNIFLQTEVAISASALLIFASNTAIIGAYHVFMALSRMEFLPSFVLKRNALRGTPHYSILLATIIPIAILIVVKGDVNTLGDMYAFGLLGAFTLTCLGLDIVRYRSYRKHQEAAKQNLADFRPELNGHNSHGTQPGTTVADLMKPDAHIAHIAATSEQASDKKTHETEKFGIWFKIDFCLGVLTTALVAIAWTTNLVNKPLATLFGGSVTVVGMAVAVINYRQHRKEGQVPVPVVVTHIEERIPDSVLAILLNGHKHNDAIIRSAVNQAGTKPIVFLYIGEPKTRTALPQMMEIVDPYLEDPEAKTSFGKAESMAINAKVPSRRYVYMQSSTDTDVSHIWQVVHPYDTVIAAEDSERFKDINPDRVRYELTSDGRVAHLLKRWEPVA